MVHNLCESQMVTPTSTRASLREVLWRYMAHMRGARVGLQNDDDNESAINNVLRNNYQEDGRMLKERCTND